MIRGMGSMIALTTLFLLQGNWFLPARSNASEPKVTASDAKKGLSSTSCG